MRVPLVVVVESIDSLRAVASQKFPGRSSVAWNIAKLLKKCETINKDFLETRDKLIRDYGEKLENGTIAVIPANQEKFVDDIAQLLRQDVEIKVQKFSIADVNTTGNIEPKHLAAVSWIFIEEDDDAAEHIVDRTETTISSPPKPGDTAIIVDGKPPEDSMLIVEEEKAAGSS